MQKKTVILLCFISTHILGGWLLCLLYGEKTILTEEFSTALHWEQQCTRADVTGRLSAPSATDAFRNIPVTSQDGMMHLCTGSVGHMGGGEWRRPVEIKVGKNTFMEWKWAANDLEDYQFWIRVKFSNNRTCYYKASDSSPPGFYRKERYIPYKGEKFRDREGRLRFFPSVTLLVARPAETWMIHRRSILKDYQQSYGQAPEDLAISEITIGMMDGSREKVNEMGIEYMKIFNKRPFI